MFLNTFFLMLAFKLAFVIVVDKMEQIPTRESSLYSSASSARMNTCGKALCLAGDSTSGTITRSALTPLHHSPLRKQTNNFSLYV